MKLFTIGFTKKSAEEFFTKSQQAGVKRLEIVILRLFPELPHRGLLRMHECQFVGPVAIRVGEDLRQVLRGQLVYGVLQLILGGSCIINCSNELPLAQGINLVLARMPAAKSESTRSGAGYHIGKYSLSGCSLQATNPYPA